MSKHKIAMARLHMLYAIPLRKKSSWIILGAVLVFSGAAISSREGGFDSWFETAIGFVTIAGSWFMLVYTGERSNTAAARMYNEGFSLTPRSEGLLYQVGEAHQIIHWPKFSKSLKTRRWFYLYFDSRWALIVPRSSFGSNEKFSSWANVVETRIQQSAIAPNGSSAKVGKKSGLDV